MLNLKDVSLTFKGQAALVSDLNLTIQPGELALLQGPSGIGKSTLLSVIAGLETTDLSWSGQIILNGCDISSLPAQDRHVGLMFQEALLFPHLNVAENLAFGLSRQYRGADRIARITEALAACDMAGFEDHDPAILSGGQKARIALMRCLLAEPKLLLMDESFSALDPALRARFGRFVADQIAQREIPALLVSHHQSDSELANGPILVLHKS